MDGRSKSVHQQQSKNQTPRAQSVLSCTFSPFVGLRIGNREIPKASQSRMWSLSYVARSQSPLLLSRTLPRQVRCRSISSLSIRRTVSVGLRMSANDISRQFFRQMWEAVAFAVQDAITALWIDGP